MALNDASEPRRARYRQYFGWRPSGRHCLRAGGIWRGTYRPSRYVAVAMTSERATKALAELEALAKATAAERAAHPKPWLSPAELHCRRCYGHAAGAGDQARRTA